MYRILEDNFCLYCQKEFKNPRAMQDHVLETHSGTYAASSILSARTAERIDPGVKRAKKKSK